MKHNSLALAISLLLGSQTVNANPTGAQVVHGTASFTTPSANVLNVTNSHNAVINWQSFNIGAGQTTNFIQPSAASAVLNRVISNNPSRLLGNLNSNGKVFLINQHGILMGEGASINTSGFFGSTLNITDTDFLNGNLKFSGGGHGGINNKGYIHAGEGGNIVLIAPNIENGGVIEVDDGNIILAAGKSITISSLENSAIQFEVSSSESSITNLGQIIANRGAASLFAGTLQHSGSIRASGLVQNADGTIRLVASGTNQVSGLVDVSAEQGGYIEILGETVELQDGAIVDASGTRNAGEILIGGDQQGLNPDIRNATSTTIAQGAKVHADGIQNGDGGRVIVFANNDVHVHGEVTAKGGELSGDGGFIETSGLKHLDITAAPDASAQHGAAGEWLIDPNNITLVSGTGASITGNPDFTSTDDSALLDVGIIQTALLSQNVTISTGTAGADSQQGNININTSITNASAIATSLTFNAHNDINIDTLSSSTIGITSANATMDVIFNADSDADGSGLIRFFTGTGNSFPITIDTNGGSFFTNTDVLIDGDVINAFSNVVISNTQWIVPENNSIILNEDLTLDLTGTVFQNNGNIIIEDTSATLDLTGDTLNLPVGSSLSGSGAITGDVDVNGGVIFGGNGYTGSGILNINGALKINSGLVYTVIGGFSTNWASNSISASSIDISGGDLMLVWEDAITAGNASADPTFASTPLSLMSCSGAGCMTGPGFTNVVNPMLVSNSAVSVVVGAGVNLNYSINYNSDIVNNANIISWNASILSGDWNRGSNWNGSIVPTAGDYVFIENISSLVNVAISGPQAAAGLQSFGALSIGSGGSLALGGDGFITPDSFDGSGMFGMNAATASLLGNGVFYMAPGSKGLLDQGLVAMDMVSWGSLSSTSLTPFQIDKNLVNNGLFFLDQNAGNNNFLGTGSIDNNGIINFGNGAHLALLGNITLNVSSTSAHFSGTGSLSLGNNAGLDFQADSKDLSSLQSLTVNGGTVENIQGVMLPSILNVSAGSLIRGVGNLMIPSTTQVNWNGGGLSGLGSVNLLSVDNQGTFDIFSGQNLNLDFVNFLNSLSGTLTGAGQVVIPTSSQLTADNSAVNVARILLNGGTLVANDFSYAGNLIWRQSGNVNGSGTGLTTSGYVDLRSGTLNTDWTISPGGTVDWSGNDADVLQVNDSTITNQGEFNVSSSVVAIRGEGRNLAAKNLSFTGVSKFVNENLLIIDATDDVVTFDLDFENKGIVAIKSGSFSLNGQDLLLNQVGSSLQGFGTFEGNVINQLGTVSPGRSDLLNDVFQTGNLTINGNYTQGADGNLVIKLDSTSAGLLNDTLNVTGQMNVDGGIGFTVINGKSPAEIALLLDQSFSPLNYGTFAGRFSDVTIPPGLNFTLNADGSITIMSDNPFLNQLSNQLEVLFTQQGINYSDMVQAMKFIDQRVLIASNDDEDEERRAPRLVCR